MVKTKYFHATLLASTLLCMIAGEILLSAPVHASIPKNFLPRISSSSSEAPGFLRIFSGETQLVSQKRFGARACGPTALLYALKLGSKEMRTAYDLLRGRDDESKLKGLIEVVARKPSLVSFHKVRLDAAEGMAPRDLFATATDLVDLSRRNPAAVKTPYLNAETLRRHDDESRAGVLVRRVYDTLRKSLVSGVPVIANFVPYVSTFNEATNTNEWAEHTGHYVVITGITNRIDDGATGFNVEYFDPETGRGGHGLVYEDLVQNFWAREARADGRGKWIHPVVKLPTGDVSSPYLAINAADLNLAPTGLTNSQHALVSFMNAIGKF